MSRKKASQMGLFEETDHAVSILDRLLMQSRLYRTSEDYQNLLDFVVRLRNFAPFNAMLLEIQKPGLSYAASAYDWKVRFGRTIREGVRPLLILWPFGPVALVYDVMDTEGEALPEDVACFPAVGTVSAADMAGYKRILERRAVDLQYVDVGDRRAGSIRLQRMGKGKQLNSFKMFVNRNHDAPVQFATLIHELGHLFLGHLCSDKARGVTARTDVSDNLREIEAESVAYIVCRRNGVEPKSETYLSGFVSEEMSTESLEIHQIMRAASQIESLLHLAWGRELEPTRGVPEQNP